MDPGELAGFDHVPKTNPARGLGVHVVLCGGVSFRNLGFVSLIASDSVFLFFFSFAT